MNTAQMTNAEIRARGWQALVDQLGASGAVRFVLQTERGWGDYSELRHEALGKLSVDELLALMPASKPSRRPRAKQRSR